MPALESSFYMLNRATTDLWRKPPATNTFNSPAKTVTSTVQAFKSVRATVRADWTRLYDQGGLIILGPADPESGSPSWWFKAGIEHYAGKPNISSVATPPGTFSWSDWAITPGLVRADGSATIEIAIAPDHGNALWFYLLQEDGSRIELREVTWWKALAPDEEIRVGTFVARPTAGTEEPQDQVVTFEDVAVVVDE